MPDFSYMSNADPSVIDAYYKRFLANPESVEDGWRRFFEGYEFARKVYGDVQIQPPEVFAKEAAVLEMIAAYRQRGHLFTKTNPVRQRRHYEGEPTLESFGLSEDDLDTVFQAGTEVGLGPVPLRDIVELLKETYCHSVGVEYKFIRTPREIAWLQKRMESCLNRARFTNEEKLHILKKLTQTVVFEKFMHSRFVGQKRFSIEGVEAVIPALDAVIEYGAERGIEELVIGTAHRGRLNILANILGKKFEVVFAEFEGMGYCDADFAGDVKYHLGFSSDATTKSGRNVHLTMTPNPSHLEAVDSVVEGLTRSKLDNFYSGDTNRIVPILIHGDASIAGQGVVYEVLQMSRLEGYQTGGTIHIVLNNQVGFTTNYLDARSSTYCTDVAKVTLSPVFHVNGDDVEAVAYVVQLAMEFRQTFKRDVFIDILGYRKHGHNEGDEPRFTQPILYKKIARHPNPMEIYRTQLADSGEVELDKAGKLEEDFKRYLEEKYAASKDQQLVCGSTFLEGTWRDLRRPAAEDFLHSPETGVSLESLRDSAQCLITLPKGPKFFTKIRKIFDARRQMIESTNRLDWAMGEQLAYATLLTEGTHVRISGQDSERGTFSHRHAVVKIEESEEEYVPLDHVSEHQAKFRIYNSPLSEYGVLGFEYGYAMATPYELIVWEAQFGDFANGGQIIIDQFISCGETKWQRYSGLVLMLPHGYEGQGPEHSSARIERYLSLCASLNIQVANCTTPANLFHALRRQLHRPFRVPLILITPKSLLRHPRCVSPLEDFAEGTRFQEVIDAGADPRQVKTVILCSGKIYYELLEKQETDQRSDVAIIRLEQLYPFPSGQLEELTRKYSSAKTWRWVQEEPENMGAWWYMLHKFHFRPLEGVYRSESSSTATGFPKIHQEEQTEIIKHAFA